MSVFYITMVTARIMMRTMFAVAAAWWLDPWAADAKKKPAVNDTPRIVVDDTSPRKPMYTLSKAKEEIDAIAKHAMDIAAHALAIDENLDAKLESFKRDILASIEVKFADLEKAIMGEPQTFESSAVSDLGAKVALLKHGSPAPAPHDKGVDDHGGDAHPSYDHDSNVGYQPDQFRQGSY